MENILIAGATGLLGSRLVPFLKGCGHHVITHAYTSQAEFMFDLSDKEKTNKMLNRVQPSVIINLVSMTSVELCEEQVALAYLCNTRPVENLAHWLLTKGSSCHLVQISTDHVYDGDDGPITEDQITITNNYALTKYAGELAAIRVPSTILRTNFVGRSQVADRESLTDWVYTSMSESKAVNVLDDVYFSPLSITVLVEMIELVLTKKPIGIYNLGSHFGMSKADFDFAFAERLKLPTSKMTRIEMDKATFFKAYRPRNMLMDSSKFENALCVKLPHLADIIEQVAKEYDEIT
jgi:dTDP-4-dehydrorhamnose reductase